MDGNSKQKIIYDVLYGFIDITPVEWELIHSPFYQRLRWIKQLGFSFYTFPGAEHSRFGHSIGVMFNSHKILESIGKAVPISELIKSGNLSTQAHYNQTIRIAALLHDIGTFPFSHTTEAAYIDFGETKKKKGHQDDHEHLGSFIIKNTDYEGGITYILKKYHIDPQQISNLVKGVDDSYLANQILHSEIDCDRMDYLLRDAHYTGLQYGTYDRDYLLHHFVAKDIGGHNVLAIKKNALHCVEDFLMSRFAWYSQVVRSARGAKFDAMAQEITYFLLEKKMIHRYSELLDMVSKKPVDFYHFNDNYFMSLLHEHFVKENFKSNERIESLVEGVLFEKSPKTVKCEELAQRLLNQDEEQKNQKIVKKAMEKIEEIEKVLEKYGTEKDWILIDLPEKDISFVRSKKRIVKNKVFDNVLHERDPVKISLGGDEVCLLVDVEESVISQLQKTINFIPNVFCSESAYKILQEQGVIEE